MQIEHSQKTMRKMAFVKN